MRSLVSHPGSNDTSLQDLAVPDPGPGEVLVQVTAAAINPIDVFVASAPGREAFALDGPVGLGWDVAGTVAAIGSEVIGFAPGDPVAGLHTDLSAPSRTHAEYVVLPAAALAAVPEGLDLKAAASVPLNALTARQALNLLGPASGRTLLVTGAAGGVGGYAIALAAADGWVVTGLARPSDAAFVRRAGGSATTIVEPAAHDAVLDAAVLGPEAIRAVKDGGAYVGVQPPRPIASERGVQVSDVQVQSDGEQLRLLLARSVTGELEARLVGELTLEEAAAGYGKVAGGGQRGRWLLVP